MWGYNTAKEAEEALESKGGIPERADQGRSVYAEVWGGPSRWREQHEQRPGVRKSVGTCTPQ